MKMCAKCGGSMKKGGATKKMAKGGVQKIVGMPGYNATLYPTSFKSGGTTSTTNRAVSPGCTGGQVKDANGKCVNERQFKKGGPIKKMQPGGATGPNPNPTGKKPFEDILGAAAGIAGILGASSYFNSDKAAARQKARLEKRDERKEARDERKEARQTARILAKSKRREEKNFKPISGGSFKKGGSVKAKKFAALAPPYDKATAADRIAGAKMKKKTSRSTKRK